DDSPTVPLDSLDLASDDHLANRAVSVPVDKRFTAWSRRYLIAIATADAVVGGIAAALPASISDTLSWGNRVAMLCLVSLVVWPAAIALCRGYRRHRLGGGVHEPGCGTQA